MPAVIITRKQRRIQRIRKFLVRLAFYMVGLILVIFAGVFCVYSFGAQTVIIDQSMDPLLQNEDVVLVNRLTYRVGKISRGDIAIVRMGSSDHSPSYARRLVGLPKETVKISGGKIYINDEEISADYITDNITYAGAAEGGITLGEDEYFALCENYNASRDDSRLDSIGLITKDRIIGKAWYRLFPFSKNGRIK